MNWGEYLLNLIKDRYSSVSNFSKQSNIPRSTINKAIKFSDFEKINTGTLIDIFSALNIPAGQVVDYQGDFADFHPYTQKEIDFIQLFARFSLQYPELSNRLMQIITNPEENVNIDVLTDNEVSLLDGIRRHPEFYKAIEAMLREK